jgi:hypothetical protein
VAVFPGFYLSTVPYEIPTFTEVMGLSKFSTQLQNLTTDLFLLQGDHTQFSNFLIEGAADPALWAFQLNNRSNVHIRNVDMLHWGFSSKQGFVRQVGATWSILFIEHCVVDSYKTQGEAIHLICSAPVSYLNDVTINDLFLDTFHLNTFGGGLLLPGCRDVRIKYSTIRSRRDHSYTTGIYHATYPGGQTGTQPDLVLRHSYVEAAVACFAQAGTTHTLIQSDCLGALTSGTRTLRNTAIA